MLLKLTDSKPLLLRGWEAFLLLVHLTQNPKAPQTSVFKQDISHVTWKC
jgi:hypothetical protein